MRRLIINFKLSAIAALLLFVIPTTVLSAGKLKQTVELFIYEHDGDIVLNLTHDIDGAIEFDRLIMSLPSVVFSCAVKNLDGTDVDLVKMYKPPDLI